MRENKTRSSVPLVRIIHRATDHVHAETSNVEAQDQHVQAGTIDPRMVHSHSQQSATNFV